MLATIIVNSLDDNMTNDGLITLREAIIAANDDRPADSTEGIQAGSGADTIQFDPSLFDAVQTTSLVMGEFIIFRALTISGPGQDLLTVDAQQQSRIFNIKATTGDFTFAGLTLTGGMTTDDENFPNVSQSGGAIRSQTTGDLTIDRSTISGNSTTGDNAPGGGVYGRQVTILGDGRCANTRRRARRTTDSCVKTQLCVRDASKLPFLKHTSPSVSST